jgi:hypothetical protein
MRIGSSNSCRIGGISQHPNLVTEYGLKLIEAALETARREYGDAQAAGDREALARAGRDLRYWSVRRGMRRFARPRKTSIR